MILKIIRSSWKPLFIVVKKLDYLYLQYIRTWADYIKTNLQNRPFHRLLTLIIVRRKDMVWKSRYFARKNVFILKKF